MIILNTLASTITQASTPSYTLEPAPAGGVPYYLYLPEQPQPGSVPLVLVHGISRNAEEHLRAFLPYAQQTGRILLAPIFDTQQGKGYQRVHSRHGRADKMLDAVLSDMRRHFHSNTWNPLAKFDLFGFSGGAQFSHRYAMFHPERIAHLAVASAGWYTFPDNNIGYPYGISTENRKGRHLTQRLEHFLKLPILVMVGARDTQRDDALRKNRKLDQQQGWNRLERALKWTETLQHTAQQQGITPTIDLTILPRCSHQFRRCVNRAGLVEKVMAWFDPPNTQSTTIRQRHHSMQSLRPRSRDNPLLHSSILKRQKSLSPENPLVSPAQTKLHKPFAFPSMLSSNKVSSTIAP